MCSPSGEIREPASPGLEEISLLAGPAAFNSLANSTRPMLGWRVWAKASRFLVRATAMDSTQVDAVATNGNLAPGWRPRAPIP
jgi:hypothetical protein